MCLAKVMQPVDGRLIQPGGAVAAADRAGNEHHSVETLFQPRKIRGLFTGQVRIGQPDLIYVQMGGGGNNDWPLVERVQATCQLE